MTKKDFKASMLRGLGRCIGAVQQEPEKYRDIVLWACKRNRAFEKDSGIPHPRHLLPLLYEYNPCSCCREYAPTDMSRHRMLTNEILEGCLYDSNV